MNEVTTAAELIDRVAERIARTRGVHRVMSNDDRLEVHLANGVAVAFAVDVHQPSSTEELAP